MSLRGCNPPVLAFGPGKQSAFKWRIRSKQFCRINGDGFTAAVRLLGTPLFLGGAIAVLFLLSSCSPVATPSSAAQVINVYSTSAAQPWLTELFACAADSPVALNITDPSSAEILLRVGEPGNLTTPAYQIDTEEILIVTHRESPVQNLSLDEAQSLFAGQAELSVQVWVYDSEEDLQKVFDQLVMAGRSVTSSARMATSPQQMSDVLNAEKSAVGILPRHWKMGDSRVVFEAGTVPVLALTKTEPDGVVRELVACLQK